MTNPREIRAAYQEASPSPALVPAICAGLDIDYVLATTDRPIGDLSSSTWSGAEKRPVKWRLVRRGCRSGPREMRSAWSGRRRT